MKNATPLLIIIAASLVLSCNITNDRLDDRVSELQVKLNEAATYVDLRDSKNSEVSEAAVSWHIDHIYLLVNEIYQTLEKSDESNYKTEFNMTRAYVFTFNKIPRGVATAPEAVRPKDNLDINTIQIHYNESLTTLEKLSNLSENKYFNHPVFGPLNRDQTIKFLTIHTEHHLKIIRDILKKK